jgi:hypothetical protein
MRQRTITSLSIFDRACHDLHDLPEGWQGNTYTRAMKGNVSVGVNVRGAVSPPYLRGPRKGEPNWPKRDEATERVVYVPHEAYAAAQKALETAGEVQS